MFAKEIIVRARVEAEKIQFWIILEYKWLARTNLLIDKKKKETHKWHEVIIKTGKSKRARNARVIDGGRASMVALVHCKLDGVLSLPLPVGALSSDYPICPSG